ncbi:hypothetical protein [Photobacterium lipolyticum]|uniref:hypothetical protein n=1 Tax=Photobacterium lipolyticum TaxID=266810 RepID=UPI001475B656|nr:hypothetical protein [Photobacterium lipolyticum]
METFLVAAGTGIISSVATVVALKVDIGWIKQTQSELKVRMDSFEKRLQKLEQK